MWLKRQDFQNWGAVGGRTRARRLTKARRRAIAREAGKARALHSTQKTDPPRTLEMESMYRSGKTLEEIGAEFGVTRERVRQILSSTGRHDRNIGGFASKTARTEKARVEHRKTLMESKALRVYGCTLANLEKIQKGLPLKTRGSPARVYREKQNDAASRNIPWEFTLPTWWKVWTDSGKWKQRGRGAKAYCMSRLGDIGPYSVSNVRIITGAENAIEGYSHVDSSARSAMRALYSSGVRELTARQKEIYELRKLNLSAGAIGKELGLKATTVSSQLSNIRRKLLLIRNDG